jgi:metallophosphoesterase (TIGR00282 family)
MTDTITVVMIGDVVGEGGLCALEQQLPRVIAEAGTPVFTVVNGENAAEGFGINEATFTRILNAGADMVTSGNHVWEKRDFWPIMDTNTRILRPANYPASAPGHGFLMLEKHGVEFLVINLQGREYMTAIDCPFRVFDAIYDEQTAVAHGNPVVLVDFHAESTREKEALAFYLDGRAAVIAGTHTHIQTADERLLPKGSGYITDLGMTGSVDGVIGMNTGICLERARTQVAYRMECAAGLAVLQGIAVTITDGKSTAICRVNGHIL